MFYIDKLLLKKLEMQVHMKPKVRKWQEITDQKSIKKNGRNCFPRVSICCVLLIITEYLKGFLASKSLE